MCGIFGNINSIEKKIDYSLLTLLGVENDKRGGDSCGLFVDDTVEYGIGKQKFFEDFIQTSEIYKKKKKAKIIMGHDRKASIGAHTIENAHPIIIKENDEIKFVFIHNGTLINHRALAAKYLTPLGIDSINFNDSKILAYIIYYVGFEVLSEYNGSAVFVCADYREKSKGVYFFKGASKERCDSKLTEIQEERPFHFLSEENGFWFSSTEKILDLYFFNTNKSVKTIQSNTVVKYLDNKYSVEYKADRSERFQKEFTYLTQSHYYYNEDAFYSNQTNNNIPGVSKKNDILKKSSFDEEVLASIPPLDYEKVLFKEGRYINTAWFLNGVFKINLQKAFGIPRKTIKRKFDGKEEIVIAFFHGYLINSIDQEAIEEYGAIADAFKISPILNKNAFLDQIPNIDGLFHNPYFSQDYQNYIYTENIENNEQEDMEILDYYTGSYVPIFKIKGTVEKVFYVDGEIKNRNSAAYASLSEYYQSIKKLIKNCYDK